MGKKNRYKARVALAAVFIGAVLCLLTYFFVQEVQTQLWEQSVNSIIESTRQGCSTLKVQLQSDYESMETVAERLEELSVDDKGQMEILISNYARLETGVVLLMPDGQTLPASTPKDENAAAVLEQDPKENGVIDPHISGVTGMNVFDLYIKTTFRDGSQGYLLKEYEVERIVDSFSISFYNDVGFSYVVNTEGEVLIRPPHPNSNKTVQNLFDMLPESENQPESLQQFAGALENRSTGWAVFNYQGEETVFCFTPVNQQTDWYLISIIPKDVVSAQTNEILIRSLILIACILLGILLLALFYLRYAKRVNSKLRSQTEYIRHLYNVVPDGIAIMSIEEPHRFLQLNEEGLRLLGYSKEEGDRLTGRYLREIIHPDEFEGIAALFHATAASGEKNLFEVQIKRTDGSYFWAAGIVEKTLDENGTSILISAIHDITEERLAKEQAEREKLQERLTLVGAISNAYPVIISMNLSNDTLRFVYVKPGLMLGLGEQRTYSELYRTVKPTLHPAHAEDFERRFSPEALLETLGHSKNEVFLEAKQQLADGNYHWISIQIIYVDNPYDENKLAILISRRIDEQKHDEEQKRQALQTALDTAKAASQAKSQFLSNMSHDIRTPMNAIIGMTAIATRNLDDQQRVQGCLKKISLSGQHLLSLINDVLDVSLIENGKVYLQPEPMNFAELTSNCIELIQPQVQEKQIDLDVRLHIMKHENVIGDPVRVRQILINILGNAVKYTPEGKKIFVEVKEENSTRKGYSNYVFLCRDTGIGMSAEFMEKLFEPFERMQDSTSSKIVGTGLGMTITKNLVDLMNGEIQVKSKLGDGSSFTVVLPLQPQEVQDEEVPGEWLGVHTLVADDDRQVCENAAELLQDMGLRAQFVTDGQTAVRQVWEAKGTADPFELCIIDWKMPDMDGIEVTRHIRAELGPEVPVIVLTAYDWSEIENEAREAGVTAFLSKPFYRSKMCYLLNELSGEKEPVMKNTANHTDYSKKRVLLVEDNVLNSEIARSLIGETGAQIDEAMDGEEAVQKVCASEEGYYDLIFMDIQMPKLNGYEATQQIRALKRRDAAHIPIVAMTANAFEEDVRKALRAGMNAHFAKPIDPKQLEQLLDQFLGEGAEQK